MDAATLFRIISLVPDRTAWAPSGSAFALENKPERVALIARLMHWLSPLEALTTENQQFLGLRSSGGRALADEAEAESAELQDDIEVDDTPTIPSPGAGTQIAA